MTQVQLKIPGSCKVDFVNIGLNRTMEQTVGSDSNKEGTPVILRDVSGFEDRKNTILYRLPEFGNGLDVDGHIVFFPGDVQDFEENMKEHPNSAEWIDWSFEKVAQILSAKFPRHHVWLVVPSKKIYKTFSIFKNFVKSESLFGVPTHDGSYGALIHLRMLLKNAIEMVSENHDIVTFSDQLTFTLIGFSKGCIVLNQVLHESSEVICKTDYVGDEMATIGRITDFYWLDGGHSGEKDNWVRDKSVLSCLKSKKWRNDLKIHVHVTPYQVKDPVHPWKGQEEAEFVAGLSDLGVNFSEKRHFEDDTPIGREESLQQHFKVLQVF